MTSGERLLDRATIEHALSRLGVLALCAEVFPDEPVPDRARLVLDDALAPDS